MTLHTYAQVQDLPSIPMTYEAGYLSLLFIDHHLPSLLLSRAVAPELHRGNLYDLHSGRTLGGC
jgi:hypothetical protein